MAFDFAYKPDGEILRDFMKCDDFFRGLRGHIGSGKSVACAVEIFRRACEQEREPGIDGRKGVRKTKWGVIRNTNPQLKTTTIATWLEWFPEEVFGKFNWSPPYTHHIKIGDIDMEVIFVALDVAADIRKLLSLELTGIWVNEAREIPKAIIDACTSRVRRFPSRKNGGPGPTWAGVIADTNPPGEDHWWGIMAGDVPPPEYLSAADLLTLAKPHNWSFFTQPPAMLENRDQHGELTGYKMNPMRENRKWIEDKYHLEMLSGKAREWINVYILNKYGLIFDGRPIYPDFQRTLHVAKSRLMPIPGHTVYVGIDFGLTPAATFAQRIRGRWVVLRELVTQNMGVTKFAPEFTRFVNEHFPGNYEFVMRGDPAGDHRVQTDEKTPFMILRANDINASPASTNDPELRIGAVTNSLNRLVDGVPGYLISPCCTTLIAAKEGGYHYKEGTSEINKKVIYSHVSDAEQYMMDGAGETRGIVRNKHANQKAFVARHGFKPGVSSRKGRVGFRASGIRGR